MRTQTIPPLSGTRQLLNKVPEVTIYFWIIKCLCTTIGETMSDNLMSAFAVGGDNATPDQLQIALYKVAAITVVVLAVLLTVQFRLNRYVPGVYWANIVVISVVGTQITDMFEGQGDQPNNMTAITVVSLTLLAAVFYAWWRVERTLSMHSIRTVRREMFYWLAILTTFATGTAVGDLIAEQFSLGYLTTLGLFAAIIAIIAVVWRFTAINAVLAFWLAYIMTRPLGASTGDELSQQGNQGLNLGTAVTSYLFLAVILALVVYLQIRKPDVTPVDLVNENAMRHSYRPGPQYQEAGGYQPRPQYQEAGGYGPGPQYQEVGGYGPRPQYQEAGGYQPRPQYQERGGYGPRPGYEEPSGYQPRPGYEEAGGYQPRPGYEEPGGYYRPRPQYQEPGGYQQRPRYEEPGGYRDWQDF